MLYSLCILAQLFRMPLDVPTSPGGLLWALPICLIIASVYKAIKLEAFRWPLFVREVLLLFATIIGFLILVALALLTIAKLAHQV